MDSFLPRKGSVSSEENDLEISYATLEFKVNYESQMVKLYTYIEI